MKKFRITTSLIAGLILSFGVMAGPGHEKMTPELKRDMAEMYTKMGECMKTEKSMEECQSDIMKNCPVVKKTGHCPLMEGMKPMDHSKMKH